MERTRDEEKDREWGDLEMDGEHVCVTTERQGERTKGGERERERKRKNKSERKRD